MTKGGMPMMVLFARLADSFRQRKSVRTLAASAMLLSLGVVLDYFGSIYVTPELKISLSFLAIASAGYLFGPASAMLCGGLLDVLMWVIKPAGAYFPGYTLSGILGGLIYAVCLYRQKGRRLLILGAVSKLLVNLIVNILINTLWSMIFTGKGYLALLSVRIPKNLILWPVESALLIVVLLFLSRNRQKILR